MLCKDGTLLAIDLAVAPAILAAVKAGGVFAFYELSVGAPVREHARIGAIEAANCRLALLADVTHVLLSSVDLPKGLAALGHLLVPSFADWVVVDLVDPESHQIERAALAHRNAERETAGIASLGPICRLVSQMTSPFARSLLYAELLRVKSFPQPSEACDEMERACLELFHALGSTDAISALRTRQRTIGAVTAVRAEGRRPYQDADLALMDDVANRMAFAVENASLLRREERRSEQMQGELLPELPTDFDDLSVVGIHRPAAEPAQVSGGLVRRLRLAGRLGCIGDRRCRWSRHSHRGAHGSGAQQTARSRSGSYGAPVRGAGAFRRGAAQFRPSGDRHCNL